MITARVPAEQAEAVKAGFEQILTTLGLPVSSLFMEIIPAAPDVLALTRQALAALEIDPADVSLVNFETDEWDNGYFYVDSPEIVFRSQDVESEYYIDDEFKPVTEALYNLHGGPLGRHDEAVVDLIKGTVEV